MAQNKGGGLNKKKKLTLIKTRLSGRLRPTVWDQCVSSISSLECCFNPLVLGDSGHHSRRHRWIQTHLSASIFVFRSSLEKKKIKPIKFLTMGSNASARCHRVWFASLCHLSCFFPFPQRSLFNSENWTVFLSRYSLLCSALLWWDVL